MGLEMSVARRYKEQKLRDKYKVPDDASLNAVLKPPRLSQEIANTIGGRYNQDVRLLCVGRQGSGKSMFSLYLGYQVACRLAEKMGGEWQDYFGLDHVAIAKSEDILRLFRDMKQYHVYLADDIGLAWGSRDFQRKANKFLNIIFQLMRTRNNFLMVSIISDFLLDKVPRNLMNFEIELSMSLFDRGIVLPKVFEIVQKPRRNKPFTVYPRYGNQKVVRYLGLLPPKELVEGYVKKREEIEREVRDQKIKELLADSEEQATKLDTPNEEKYRIAQRLIEDGKSKTKACELVGVDRGNFSAWEGKQKRLK